MAHKHFALNWILEFVQQELDGLSGKDREQKGFELWIVLKELNRTTYKGSITTDKEVKKSLELYGIKGIFEMVKESGDLQPYVDALDKSQEIFKIVIAKISILLDISSAPEHYDYPMLDRAIREQLPLPVAESDSLITVKATLGRPKPILSSMYDPQAEILFYSEMEVRAPVAEGLLFHFLRLLDDVSPASFLQCPECNAWFVHTSKKKRTYCSNKCASRYGARKISREKRKDKHTWEEEKRKGRQRARKSYEKKVQDEVGPNAIPARRPYKYKDKKKGE